MTGWLITGMTQFSFIIYSVSQVVDRLCFVVSLVHNVINILSLVSQCAQRAPSNLFRISIIIPHYECKMDDMKQFTFKKCCFYYVNFCVYWFEGLQTDKRTDTVLYIYRLKSKSDTSSSCLCDPVQRRR